jgi:hypothetical protein
VALDGQTGPLRHLHQFQPLHVRPRDIRSLRPVATEHHRHASLRAVSGGIVITADLLASRRPSRQPKSSFTLMMSTPVSSSRMAVVARSELAGWTDWWPVEPSGSTSSFWALGSWHQVALHHRHMVQGLRGSRIAEDHATCMMIMHRLSTAAARPGGRLATHPIALRAGC